MAPGPRRARTKKGEKWDWLPVDIQLVDLISDHGLGRRLAAVHVVRVLARGDESTEHAVASETTAHRTTGARPAIRDTSRTTDRRQGARPPQSPLRAARASGGDAVTLVCQADVLGDQDAPKERGGILIDRRWLCRRGGVQDRGWTRPRPPISARSSSGCGATKPRRHAQSRTRTWRQIVFERTQRRASRWRRATGRLLLVAAHRAPPARIRAQRSSARSDRFDDGWGAAHEQPIHTAAPVAHPAPRPSRPAWWSAKSRRDDRRLECSARRQRRPRRRVHDRSIARPRRAAARGGLRPKRILRARADGGRLCAEGRKTS